MKQTGIFGLFALCATAAFAAQHKHHHHHKRDEVVVVVDTVVVWDVVVETVTAGSAPSPAADNYVPPSSSSAATTSSSPQAYVPPPAAAPPSSSSTYVPPPQVPASHPAPPPPVSSSSSQAPPAQSPAPAGSGSGSSGSTGGSPPSSGSLLYGDITYYDASGLSTCGYELSNSNNTVAIALGKFNGVSNSGVGQPSSPLCNKKINIYPSGPSGKAVEVIVIDGCQGCGPNDLDLPTNFFEQIMPDQGGKSAMDVGRYSQIAWEWAD